MLIYEYKSLSPVLITLGNTVRMLNHPHRVEIYARAVRLVLHVPQLTLCYNFKQIVPYRVLNTQQITTFKPTD